MEKNFKQRKGITLIALVITIIVLLILAGVSIAMITGENGILKRAAEAKEKSERLEIIETAQIDIAGKQIENDGGLSEEELVEILTSVEYNTKGTLSDNGEESVLDKILTSSDGQYQIPVSEIYNGPFTQNANPEDEPGATKNATSEKALAINEKIGENVSGYTANNISNWQVFYATDNEVFIISEDIAQTSFTVPEIGVGKTNAYSGIGDVRSSNYNYGKNWNSKWIEVCESAPISFDITNTTSSAKMTAYMCDSDNWTSYVSAPANYAVGGPTIELLIASIAAKGETDETSNISVNSNGYELIDSLVQYNSLSIPYKDSRNYPGYWIASPDGELRYSTNLWIASTRLFSNYYDLDGATPGIRPLVSIPISNIDETTLVISAN